MGSHRQLGHSTRSDRRGPSERVAVRPVGLHRRFRQLGQLDGAGLSGDEPRADASGPRSARRCAGTRPLVVDPFAGGGRIPLEALRVGADAFASDLNPVPVLLNKVVLEYIPKYGQRLADEVRKWGEWIKQEAEKELAEFYPKDPDGATPIAYLWARTIAVKARLRCGGAADAFPLASEEGQPLGGLATRAEPAEQMSRFPIIVKQGRGWVDQADEKTKFEIPIRRHS